MAQAVAAAPDGALWLPSLRKGRDDWQQLLESLARLYTHGATIDWAGRRPAPAPRRTVTLPDLPVRARAPLDHPGGPTRRGATRRAPAIRSSAAACARRWPRPSSSRSSRPSNVDFLRDHRVFDTAILPATGFVEMALAAGERRARRPTASSRWRSSSALGVADGEARSGPDDRDPRRRGGGRSRSSASVEDEHLAAARARARSTSTTPAPAAADLDRWRAPAQRHGRRPTSTTTCSASTGSSSGPACSASNASGGASGEVLGRIGLPAEPGPYAPPPRAPRRLPPDRWPGCVEDREATYLPFAIGRVDAPPPTGRVGRGPTPSSAAAAPTLPP